MQHPTQQPTLAAGGDTAPQPGCDTAEQRTHSVTGGRADREAENMSSPVFAGSVDLPLPPAPQSTTSRIAAVTLSLWAPLLHQHKSSTVKKYFSQSIHPCLDFWIQTFLPKSRFPVPPPGQPRSPWLHRDYQQRSCF